MIFHPGTAWHEHREVRGCGHGVDDREKPRQHGECLQRALNRGLIAEFSLNEEIDREIQKRDEKEARPKKCRYAGHVRPRLQRNDSLHGNV